MPSQSIRLTKPHPLNHTHTYHISHSDSLIFILPLLACIFTNSYSVNHTFTIILSHLWKQRLTLPLIHTLVTLALSLSLPLYCSNTLITPSYIYTLSLIHAVTHTKALTLHPPTRPYHQHPQTPPNTLIPPLLPTPYRQYTPPPNTPTTHQAPRHPLTPGRAPSA